MRIYPIINIYSAYPEDDKNSTCSLVKKFQLKKCKSIQTILGFALFASKLSGGGHNVANN